MTAGAFGATLIDSATGTSITLGYYRHF